MNQENILQHLILTAEASRELNLLPNQKIDLILNDLSLSIIQNQDFILTQNQKDLIKMDPQNPKYDRLQLTPERLSDIASAIQTIAEMPSPLGEIIEQKILDNGLRLQKIRVPLGVIAIIFEARPNVFFDCFALCFKSKNACVLKGSKDAEFSNKAIYELIQKVLIRHNLNEHIVYHPPADRQSLQPIFHAHGLIDVLIPRGSQSLIDFVRENSRIPTIETGAGVVHTYFDQSGDPVKAKQIIFNAKTQRPSVCNALDCLIIHQSRLASLPMLLEDLITKNVLVFADHDSHIALINHYPDHLLQHADVDSFGTEFLDYKLAVKTVNNLDEALMHIAQFSSKHSEAIIAEDDEIIEKFLTAVDAAAVYANASTRFTDGGVFGLGAEIGISTQKLHARGPMGLKEITGYKWVVRGDGQVR